MAPNYTPPLLRISNDHAFSASALQPISNLDSVIVIAYLVILQLVHFNI